MAQMIDSLSNRTAAMRLANRIRYAVLTGSITHEEAVELYHQIDDQHSTLMRNELGAVEDGLPR